MATLLSAVKSVALANSVAVLSDLMMTGISGPFDLWYSRLSIRHLFPVLKVY